MTRAAPAKLTPIERADEATVDRQARSFEDIPLLNQLANAIPDAFLILNEQRQIVYANKRLFELFDAAEWREVRGKLPGEVLDCVHATDAPGGCGTSEFCATCGSVNAVLESHSGKQSVKECSILTHTGTALELRIWATPYERDGEMFTLYGVVDVSGEKRRIALERTFFHDVLNTAGGLAGLSSVLQQEDDLEMAGEIARMIFCVSEQLIEEIQSQKQLIAAEHGELEATGSRVSSLGILQEVGGVYSRHKAAEGRHLQVSDASDDVDLITDPVLLRRVIGNMMKNALEATRKGGTVTASCSAQGESVKFVVHNPTHMPREVELQIFQRSFSTKGEGRGIGTYSMKLFAEHYLGATVEFTTSKEGGTTFWATVPVQAEHLSGSAAE